MYYNLVIARWGSDQLGMSLVGTYFEGGCWCASLQTQLKKNVLVTYILMPHSYYVALKYFSLAIILRIGAFPLCY